MAQPGARQAPRHFAPAGTEARNGAAAPAELDGGDLAAVELGAEELAAEAPAESPRGPADVWGSGPPLTLADLVGTSTWLDAVAELSTHERIKLGLRFKLFSTDRGEPALVQDFGTEVPTETTVLDRYGSGRYLVRASARRAGKGGGHLQEVRFQIAPPRGAASGSDAAFQADRLFDLLRETLRGERAALVEKSKPAKDDVTPPAWVGRMVEELAPLLGQVKEGKSDAGDLLSHPIVRVLLDRLMPRPTAAAAAAAADGDSAE